MASPTVVNAASQTFAAGTSVAVTLPASLVVGNLLVLYVQTRDTANTPTISDLSWAVVGSTGYGTAFWKLISGSEGATVTVAWINSSAGAALVAQINGSSSFPIEVYAVAASTSANYTAPTVTPKWNADLLLSFYSGAIASAITVPGGQSNIGGTTGNSANIILGYETLASNSATGTRIATSSSATWGAINILVREPSAAGVSIDFPFNHTDYPNAKVYGPGAGQVDLGSGLIGLYGQYKLTVNTTLSGVPGANYRVVITQQGDTRPLRSGITGPSGVLVFDRLPNLTYTVYGTDINDVRAGFIQDYVTPEAM